MSRSFPLHPISAVLGNKAGVFAHLLDQLLPELNGVEYEFMANDHFAKLQPPEMNRVYWTEILYRSHWVAAGTLVRTHRWLSGFRSACEAINLLAAAACARGLMEAAADAEYTLRVVPSTLAQDHKRIATAIRGELPYLAICSDLEERLIHFTHARKPKKGESIAASHVARQVVQYRDNLDRVNAGIATCYSELCDLTHPGASSVISYAEAIATNAGRIRFSLTSESAHIDELKARMHNVIVDVLMLGLNPALMTLKLLSFFPLSQLHTSGMDNVGLDDIPAWQNAMASLGTKV